VSGGQPEFIPVLSRRGGRAWMACSWKYTTIPMRRKRRRECAGYAQPARLLKELQRCARRWTLRTRRRNECGRSCGWYRFEDSGGECWSLAGIAAFYFCLPVSKTIRTADAYDLELKACGTKATSRLRDSYGQGDHPTPEPSATGAGLRSPADDDGHSSKVSGRRRGGRA